MNKSHEVEVTLTNFSGSCVNRTTNKSLVDGIQENLQDGQPFYESIKMGTCFGEYLYSDSNWKDVIDYSTIHMKRSKILIKGIKINLDKDVHETAVYGIIAEIQILDEQLEEEFCKHPEQYMFYLRGLAEQANSTDIKNFKLISIDMLHIPSGCS